MLTMLRGGVLLGMLFLPALSWGAGEFPVLSVPPSQTTLHVAISLPKGPASLASGAGKLVEIGGAAEPIPVQGVPVLGADGSGIHKTNLLVADIPPRRGAAAARRFRLGPAAAEESRFRFVDVDDKSLKLLDRDKPVLVYNYGTITSHKVPANDARRNRACYIHPLWGLNGEVLTDDFPKDHYHHHGVFWAWPHVGIDGKEYDLWDGREHHARFVRWLGRRGRAAGRRAGRRERLVRRRPEGDDRAGVDAGLPAGRRRRGRWTSISRGFPSTGRSRSAGPRARATAG